MQHLSRARLLILAVAAALFLAACGTGEEAAAPDDTAPQGAEEATPEPVETDEPEVAETETEEVEEATGAELPAEELRITLERQLGQHAALAIDAMRSGVTGNEDFEAAAAALDRNTQDLTSSIELVYGAEGAAAFEEMWSDHIGFFVDYTVGLAEGDQQAQDDARAQLEQYRQDFSTFLEGASEGNIPADVVAEGLQVHVNQLVAQIDAFHAEDYETAYANEREAYGHMFETAQALAGGIAAQFPERFPSDGSEVSAHDGHTATTISTEVAQADAEVPAVDLRSLLGQQLGEHADLAVKAMRKGLTGQPDFEQAAASLEQNTQDLTSSIELVYGPEGAAAFETMWSDHIDFFVSYTVGLAEDDQQAQDEALERLEQYRQDFSTFLEGASEENIPADVVAEGLQVHVNQLVAQIDAYNEGSFDEAYDQAYEAYNHMYETAEALAGGIAAQFPDRFPGDAGTGGEGMDHGDDDDAEATEPDEDATE
jgi:2-hydroxy-3-keto-5-methylthiopentenyl-1-phosphate phosphatase